MKLHHINIKAPRELLTKEKNFFCDVLGLHQGARPNLSYPGFWLYGKGKNSEAIVHLSEGDAKLALSTPTYFDHVAFQSTGASDFIDRLAQLNVKYNVKYLSENKMIQVFVRSPTNMRIEINFLNENIK